ncbi:MAG: hypothetical protein HY329_03390 [Chloroflexi bacterium]|nr:hypothetical protein [Chloroflexota bacterium]
MTAVGVLVLAVAVLGFVLAPLWRPATRRLHPNTSAIDHVMATRERLATQRDALYQTLRDLELDHQIGNVDDLEYAELRDRYRRRAAQVLRELDALDAGDDEVERAVRALRRADDDGREESVKIERPADLGDGHTVEASDPTTAPEARR